MSKENNKKEVVKRLSSRERREDIVKIIREIVLKPAASAIALSLIF